MPRMFEVKQELDELRAKMQEAHAILGEALGFDQTDEPDDAEDDDDDVEYEEDED